MLVTFHGVRGSVPTPGPSTVRYGGNTVCVSVRTADDTLIVLDAGTGVRELGNQLIGSPALGTIHVYITHVHWDHVIGAPFFAPLWRKDTTIHLHALSETMRERLHDSVLFDGMHFPVKAIDIPATVIRAPVVEAESRVGSAVVRRIALNHPGGADGFRIDDSDGSSVCYLTDNELAPPGIVTTPLEELARFAHGAGLVIHDAQYLPSDMPAKHGWGHSLLGDVLALGRAAECRTLALHHHDPDRADADLDLIAADARQWTDAHAKAMRVLVAYEGLRLEVKPG